MSKFAKVTVFIMVAIIVIYVIIGMYNNSDDSPDVTPSGDNVTNLISGESGEDIGEEYLSNITYELTSGDNEILLTSIGSGEKSTTKYIIENDQVSKIVVVEEVFSGDEVNVMYENLKKDPNISQVYDSIEVVDNTIVMVLRKEYAELFSGKTKEQVYEELETAMEAEAET